MRTPNSPLLTFALSAAGLAAHAAAQCPPSLSFLAGVPTAVSFAETQPGLAYDTSAAYFAGAGFHRTPPTEWPAGTGIHFRLRDALANCAPTGATLPDIDAMSTGLDWVLVDGTTGQVQVPPNRWAVINLSVSWTSRGTAASLIAQESGGANGAGSDLFSYVMGGSSLPAELVSELTRTHDDSEIDVGAGGAIRDVDALDQFMPMWNADPELAAMMPDRPSIFFSVSNATLTNVPTTWWGGTPRSGATIFRIIWSPTTNGWSCPRVYKTFADLGLQQTEDIDALALDFSADKMLISTKTRSRNEILVVECATDGPVMPIEVKEGVTPVSDKIGLVPDDDVDALCGIDPSFRVTQPGIDPNPWFYYCGTPLPQFFVPRGTAEASAFRIRRPGGAALHIQMVGWPPLTGQGPGLAALLFSPPNQFGPFVSLLGEFRNPAPFFCGDPRTFVLNLPAGLPLHFEFDLRWFLADNPVTEFYDTHPLRIRL